MCACGRARRILTLSRTEARRLPLHPLSHRKQDGKADVTPRRARASERDEARARRPETSFGCRTCSPRLVVLAMTSPPTKPVACPNAILFWFGFSDGTMTFITTQPTDSILKCSDHLDGHNKQKHIHIYFNEFWKKRRMKEVFKTISIKAKTNLRRPICTLRQHIWS